MHSHSHPQDGGPHPLCAEHRHISPLMSSVSPASQSPPSVLSSIYFLIANTISPMVAFRSRNCSFRMSVLKFPSQTMGASQGVRTRTSFLLHRKRATGQHVSWQEGEHTKGPGAHHPHPGPPPPPPPASIPSIHPQGIPSFQRDFTLSKRTNEMQIQTANHFQL